MLGHDHALSGALAFVAVAPLLPVSGTQLAVAATLTAGAGILPDLDEPGSTIARTFGFLTGAFAWIVHQLSGGHRKGTPGTLAHVAGDMLTHDGCPLLYPVSRYEFGLLPEPIRITTNKLAERWVISPLLLAGLAYFVYRDAAPALTTAASGGWP